MAVHLIVQMTARPGKVEPLIQNLKSIFEYHQKYGSLISYIISREETNDHKIVMAEHHADKEKAMRAGSMPEVVALREEGFKMLEGKPTLQWCVPLAAHPEPPK